MRHSNNRKAKENKFWNCVFFLLHQSLCWYNLTIPDNFLCLPLQLVIAFRIGPLLRALIWLAQQQQQQQKMLILPYTRNLHTTYDSLRKICKRKNGKIAQSDIVGSTTNDNQVKVSLSEQWLECCFAVQKITISHVSHSGRPVMIDVWQRDAPTMGNSVFIIGSLFSFTFSADLSNENERTHTNWFTKTHCSHTTSSPEIVSNAHFADGIRQKIESRTMTLFEK